MTSRTVARACVAALSAVAAALLLAGPALALDGSTVWSGSGSPADPYLIGSTAGLKRLADDVNAGTPYDGAHFELTADIDLEDTPWTPVGGACPLGEDGVPAGDHFGGVFDGAGHTIGGLNVAGPSPGTGAYGLFGFVDGAVIANLRVAGSLDMGTSPVDGLGGVVGYARASSLYNVHSAVNVSMHDATYGAGMCGGVAGAVDNPSGAATTFIRYCSNTGSVTGRGRVGGIVGAVSCVADGGVVVDQCFNTGDVTSTTSFTKIYTGGIAGYCRGSISACYNRGRMATNGGHYLAGIVGILQGADPVASLGRCYSTAVFDTYDPGWDRFLWASADLSSAVRITDCYWLPDPSNADMTQPYDAAGAWGTQMRVSAVTAAQLEGTERLTGGNATGTFDGYLVDDYLGAVDLDDPHGSYGFGYAAAGGYPVLGWELIPDFEVDPADVPVPPRYYSVSVTIPGGHGTATAGPAEVEAGGSFTVTLAPDAGYWLESVTDNGADVTGSVAGDTYTVAGVAGDHAVIVTYTDGTHVLAYTAGAHGSIAGSRTQSVADGADGAAVTAVPSAGHRFAAWTDGSTANPRTDAAVVADLAVKAIFLPDDTHTVRPWDHFTLAVLPDTQFYSQDHPAIFDAQTQWIADHAKAENIVFVAHLGDVVEAYNSAAQWRNAQDSMAIVRAAGIPYTIVPGNHDIGYLSHDVSSFDAAFPFTSFTGYPWYGGHHPAASNASSYALFSAMGQDFVVLNLVSDPTLFAGAVDWANAVLTTHADRKAIVVAHGYIDGSGALLSGGSVAGAAVWDDVVSRHANVVAVLCGHVAGEHAGASTGAGGATVHNLLTDYQDEPNGGNGWLRLYEFYPLQDRIRARTYSPYLDRYQTDADSQFDLPLEQRAAAGAARVVKPAAGARLRAGTLQSVRFSVARPFSDGEFGVHLVRGGASTLLAAVNAAPGQSTYSLPWRVRGAAARGCVVRVGWRAGRGDAWTTVGESGAFRVLKAGAITVTVPGADAAWPSAGVQTVRWKVPRAAAGRGGFSVTLRDAAGRVSLSRPVRTRRGVTTYATKLRVTSSTRPGVYTVRVARGALSGDSPPFRVVPGQALRFTSPAGRDTWSAGGGKTVSWALYDRLVWGSFDLRLRSAGGRTWTLVPAFSPGSYPGRYSAAVTLPAGVPAAGGYRLVVRWRDGTSALSARSAPITVRR